MIAFRRLSSGPTLPDLIRAAAAEDAVRIAQMMPLEVWCRPATICALRSRPRLSAPWPGVSGPSVSGPSVSGPSLSGPSLSGPSALPQARSAAVMTEIRAWTGAAEIVLRATRLCNRAGLLSPEGVGAGFRWSSWLIRRGMRTWQRTRPMKSSKPSR